MTDQIELSTEDSIQLWLSGRDNWNRWVSDHPDAQVSFQNVEFAKYRIQADTKIDFSCFKFPANGHVSFDGANFGDGGVNFTKAEFGKGILSFISATFGKGDVLFEFVTFGCRKLMFSHVNFDSGILTFSGSIFRNCDIDFSNTCFGSRETLFSKVQSFKGDVNFSNSIFTGGHVCFFESIFKGHLLIFNNAKFVNSSAIFTGAVLDFDCAEFSATEFLGAQTSFAGVKFKVPIVNFSAAKFCGDTLHFDSSIFNGVNFNAATFKSKEIYFDNATFAEHVFLYNIMNDSDTMLSFRFATFCKSFEFSNTADLSCIPDFRGTKTNNHFEVSAIKYKLKRKWGFLTATDPEDANRLCRLKEISESNKDHRSALRFHADGMRALRWSEGTSFLSNVLDAAFDISSSYGLSIFRPFMFLMFIFISMTLYTVGYQPPIIYDFNRLIEWVELMKSIELELWVKSAEYVLGHLIPFIGGVQEHSKISKHAIDHILPSHYGLMSILFTIPSYIFIFLIGLGLRNRFRI